MRNFLHKKFESKKFSIYQLEIDVIDSLYTEYIYCRNSIVTVTFQVLLHNHLCAENLFLRSLFAYTYAKATEENGLG